MRIKFQNNVIEIESFDIIYATNHEEINAFIYIDGAYWKEYTRPIVEDEPKWEYKLLGEFCLGKYRKNWREIGEKFTNEISTKMLEQGYIDLDKYKNFELY